MRDKGQNLVEFLIIIAVVALGGIMALTLLGGNINEMFSKSVDKTANYKPFGYNNNTTTNNSNSSSTTNNSTPEPSTNTTPASSMSVDGVDVTINTDGSANFTVGTQNVNIPSSAMESLSDVFMSTGIDGDQLTTEVVQAISSLIAAHKDEYPNGDVPINMSFGTSLRDQSDVEGLGGGHYAGDASFNSNSITLSVGNDVTLIQKDQSFQGQTTTDGVVHVIEGSIVDIYGDGNTYFQGQVSSSMPGMNGQTYTSFIPVTSATGNINGSIGGASDGITGNWSFDFSGTNYDL